MQCALAAAILVGWGAAPAEAGHPKEVEVCVRSQGYWKNHPQAWPVGRLVLGNPANPAHTYTAKELMALLRQPVRGDASLNLAHQLIAARLNVATGSKAGPIASDLARADLLLGAFRRSLPHGVAPRTPIGTDMIRVAGRLDEYNEGRVPGSCGPVNRPPAANAGPDQTVPVGAIVALDGTGSSDPDGQPLTFTWNLVARPTGSTAVLAHAATAHPTFVADVPGQYAARLTVNDGTLTSAPDMVVVSTLNSAPTADAGPDQTRPWARRCNCPVTARATRMATRWPTGGASSPDPPAARRCCRIRPPWRPPSSSICPAPTSCSSMCRTARARARPTPSRSRPATRRRSRVPALTRPGASASR